MNYLLAFLVGGFICGLGQLFLDLTNYTPAHLLVILVVSGAVLTGLGLYQPIIDFAGGGVTVLVINFGHVLAKGVLAEVERLGFLGLFAGILEIGSIGISASIVLGFLMSVIFRPKE
ncbi:SpoVA/SpoVAEb family sporulation membrane protein [Fuchsiella alkaliacetigena]|uniref:SpoVA/SpoVAEb family sporulation membrane protein n=1 Tax=Fuchsiella alkaliacetigena TaxID=957042 RepID=UPI00200A522A|nr:SpoVA/SpoVAEb family sporulation membrane protein [Fuchsiella alkaliacetigena]MCK8825169.1 SpoVA/SpoVAEb family sporulation membrane protein [Fuchsiella alkaliacetigena]